MPYVYVGRRNFYVGKTLFEILGNLRNFGVGRMLVRSKFERYPEVSYYRIVRAEPLMDEKNLFGRVWVDQVFRGRPFQELIELTKVTYKNDFKLVPKDQEEEYIRRTLPLEAVDDLKKPLPEFREFPPLLREMIKEEEKIEEPLLKVVYSEGLYNFQKVVPGMVRRERIIDGTVAPHLYENVKQS